MTTVVGMTNIRFCGVLEELGTRYAELRTLNARAGPRERERERAWGANRPGGLTRPLSPGEEEERERAQGTTLVPIAVAKERESEREGVSPLSITLPKERGVSGVGGLGHRHIRGNRDIT